MKQNKTKTLPTTSLHKQAYWEKLKVFSIHYNYVIIQNNTLNKTDTGATISTINNIVATDITNRNTIFTITNEISGSTI